MYDDDDGENGNLEVTISVTSPWQIFVDACAPALVLESVEGEENSVIAAVADGVTCVSGSASEVTVSGTVAALEGVIASAEVVHSRSDNGAGEVQVVVVDSENFDTRRYPSIRRR